MLSSQASDVCSAYLFVRITCLSAALLPLCVLGLSQKCPKLLTMSRRRLLLHRRAADHWCLYHQLLFGVTSYATCRPIQAYETLFNTTQPDNQSLPLGARSILGLNPWRTCYWVVQVDDCTTGSPDQHMPGFGMTYRRWLPKSPPSSPDWSYLAPSWIGDRQAHPPVRQCMLLRNSHIKELWFNVIRNQISILRVTMV